MTASYSLQQYKYLLKAVECMRDICNANHPYAWNVTIHLQVVLCSFIQYTFGCALICMLPHRYFIPVKCTCVIPIVVTESEYIHSTSVIQVANGLNSSHHLFRELQSIAYCTRTHTYIPIIVEQFNPKIGFGLNSRHRLYLLNHVHEYDFVIYAEEDMLLTVR